MFTNKGRRFRNRDLRWHPHWAEMSGPKPPDDFVSNGNTNAPDIVFGVDTRPAGHFHDYHYDKPGSEPERFIADQLFRYNMGKCGVSGLLSPVRFFHYFRLRLWGHKYFKYKPGEEPVKDWWFWMRLFWGRYLR